MGTARTGRKRRRSSKKPTKERLAPEWIAWIGDNLVQGAEPEALVRALAGQGVPTSLARREVEAQASSPLMARLRLAEQRLALETRLQRSLAGTSAPAVPVVPSLDAETFYREYYAFNRPVLVTDWVRRWPAFGRWTPAHFAEQLGDVLVTVSLGRDSDPNYDMNEAKLRAEMTVAELVDRMQSDQPSNDVYMVARNRNLTRPRFRALVEEVALDPEIFDPETFFGGAQLWMGPAGTVTPMHHDTSNILFCQVYGKKRVTLVPRWESALVRSARQLYSTFDPEAADFDAHPGLTPERVLTVDVDAGDALFIPVGWWHHVRALSSSISLACVNFKRDNDFRWYRPHTPLP